MRLEVDFTKGIRENADAYYALSKKSKKKLDGLARGVKEIERKMLLEERKKIAPKKFSACKKLTALLLILK